VKDFSSWRVYANTSSMLIIFILCYRGINYRAARIASSDALEPTG
jgi:hypothetical protein